MIVDHISKGNTYQLGPTWEAVLMFLSGLSPEAEEKNYSIDGEKVFARVMTYAGKEDGAVGTVLEAHRKFADVHMTLIGSERFGMWPRDTLKVKTAYNPDNDVEFYAYEKKADLQLCMQPGMFALFLPQDAHMPGLHAGEVGATIKKVVVKIALDLLEL